MSARLNPRIASGCMIGVLFAAIAVAVAPRASAAIVLGSGSQMNASAQDANQMVATTGTQGITTLPFAGGVGANQPNTSTLLNVTLGQSGATYEATHFTNFGFSASDLIFVFVADVATNYAFTGGMTGNTLPGGGPQIPSTTAMSAKLRNRTTETDVFSTSGGNDNLAPFSLTSFSGSLTVGHEYAWIVSSSLFADADPHVVATANLVFSSPVNPPGPAVPLPAAVWAGLSLAGMIGIKRSRRR